MPTTTKATGKRPVIRCMNPDGCDGECAVATIGGKTLSDSKGDRLAVCTTCWSPRVIGQITANRMNTTTLPKNARRSLLRRALWAPFLRGIV